MIETMAVTPTRIRINVSTSVKGVKTFDVTVEMADPDQALAESDRLVAELDKRYPNQEAR